MASRARVRRVLLAGAGLLLLGAAWTFWGKDLVERARSGFVRVQTFRPAAANGLVVAVSPEGDTLATTVPRGTQRDAIELWSVATGRLLLKTELPQAAWSEKGRQYAIERRLRYCDQGRYLLAFDRLDRLYVLDSTSLQPKATVVIPDLRVKVGPDGETRALRDLKTTSRIEVDCASTSPALAVRIGLDHENFVMLFDVERGAEMADLSSSVDGRWGHGIAVSPDGTKVALGTWNRAGDAPKGNVVEVLDAQGGGPGKRFWFDPLEGPVAYQLAFAGDRAVVIGNAVCGGNALCPEQGKGQGEALRVMDLKDGSVQRLEVEGTRSSRSSGASSDGSVVFGYTGVERECASCNHGAGELIVEKAQFTEWTRASGKVLARSPSLAVTHYRCPLLMIGPCEDSDTPPALAMSADGRTVAAVWMGGGANVPGFLGPAGKIEVYRRR